MGEKEEEGKDGGGALTLTPGVGVDLSDPQTPLSIPLPAGAKEGFTVVGGLVGSDPHTPLSLLAPVVAAVEYGFHELPEAPAISCVDVEEEIPPYATYPLPLPPYGAAIDDLEGAWRSTPALKGFQEGVTAGGAPVVGGDGKAPPVEPVPLGYDPIPEPIPLPLPRPLPLPLPPSNADDAARPLTE